MNVRNPALTLAVSLALGGCAIAPKPDVQFISKPFTLRLAQIPILDRDAVRGVVTEGKPKADPQAEQETTQTIDDAQAQAMAEMDSAFAAFPGLHVNDSPLKLPLELDRFPIVRRNEPLTPGVLAALRDTSNADALLRFGISDYGRTPKEWRNAVITFEVVSTLGIAAVAYARPATRSLAGVYLAQETVEETVEEYSGLWALDEVYRPVRVEVEMIDLHTGRRVWADTQTGFSDRRLSRLYSTVTRVERKAQLRAALHEAIAKVVRDFQKSAGRPAAPVTTTDTRSARTAGASVGNVGTLRGTR